MANLLHIYKKLIKDLMPENAENSEWLNPDTDLFIANDDVDNMPSTGIAKSTLHHLQVHKTKERALNSMAVHNMEKWLREEYDRNLYKVERNLLLARILIKKAYIQEGTVILQSTYKTVCKYQHTAYSLLYAQELCMRYAMSSRHKLFFKYERALKFHFANFKSETICLQAYHKAVSLVANRWDVSNASVKKVGVLYGVVKKEKTNHATHVNMICLFRVGIYYYQIAEKYNEVIRLANQFEQYLKRNKHLLLDARMAEVAHYLVNACIALNKFSQGIKSVGQYRVYFNKGNFNLVSFMELKMQLLLHAGNYAEALHLYNEVTATSLFKKAANFKKEIWHIYKAYIDYALRDANMLKSFRTAKFINMFEQVSKEKQGLNFEMMVIAYIYKLVKANTEDVQNFIVYFDGYVKRNIRRKHYFRSYYFSKMLQLIFKYKFNPVKVEATGKKYLMKLKINPHPKRNDKKILEIIPYEKLWLMMIRLLKENEKKLLLLSAAPRTFDTT